MIKKFFETYIISIYSVLFSSLLFAIWQNSLSDYLCVLTIWSIGAYFGYLVFSDRKYLIRPGSRLHLFKKEWVVVSLNNNRVLCEDNYGNFREVHCFWAVLSEFIFKVEDFVDFFIIERRHRELYYRKMSGKIIQVLDPHDSYIIESTLDSSPIIFKGISKRFILYRTL